MRYDVIVVGAGQAGSACAFDLATAGLSVLLLERDGVPRAKACGGGITPKALRRYRFPIVSTIRRIECEMRVSLLLARETMLTAPAPICVMTVRAELDALCRGQAIGAGARFEKIAPIQAIDERDHEVCVTVAGGRKLHAGYLVGADGANSTVRRLSGGHTPVRRAFAIEGIARVPTGVPPPMTLDFGMARQGYGWLFPKGDHVNLGLYTRRPAGASLSKDSLRDYAQRRLGVPRAAVEGIVGFPIGAGGESYRQRSERVLLVGDAAGMAEVLLGEGIHNAVATGQMAAKAIVRALTSEDGNARRRYNDDLSAVHRDLRHCRRLAQLYYGLLPAAYAVLSTLVGETCVSGFAAGMTASQWPRALLTGKRGFDYSATSAALDGVPTRPTGEPSSRLG